MKHPAYRISDILYMDHKWRDKAFDYVREGVKLFVPFAAEAKIQLVGSYAFGNASLFADMDFNLSLKDWNAQVPARRWFYTAGNRKDLVDYLKRFQDQWGLKIDCGCVDCETDLYNVYVDLDKMVLHFRTGEPNQEFLSGALWPEVLKPDPNPIDLNNLPQDLPPPLDQHLRLDNYAFRWLRVPKYKSPNNGFPSDPFAAEIPEWQKRYGDKFITYKTEPAGDGVRMF
jgi:hypothetical protein